MERSPQRTRARRTRFSPRAWLAALIALLVVSTVGRWPVYRDRLASSWAQTLLLPHRLTESLDAITFDCVGTPYGIMEATRVRSFDDAVIVISDDPRDAPLDNVLWCAYYLYPRVLVHESGLAPEIQPDFEITTAHFGRGPSGEGGGAGLRALSERARLFAAANWNP